MANPMFYLIKNNSTILLPVPPSEFKLQTASGNQSLDIYNLGEINLPGKSKLSTITLESFFPAQDYQYVQILGNTDPWLIVDTIKNTFLNTTEPFRFIITETKVNDLFLMDSFDYGIVDGTKDVWFSMTLKQYKVVTFSATNGGLTSVVTVTGNEARADDASSGSGQRTHVVQSGDCLWNLAKQYYGDGSKYTVIQNANSQITNPDLIYDGDTLIIPYI
jgi:LysM repeat protein